MANREEPPSDDGVAAPGDGRRRPDVTPSSVAEARRRQLATLLEHSPDATVVLDAQAVPPFESRWERRDGSWSNLSVTVAPIRAGGGLAGAVAILRAVAGVEPPTTLDTADGRESVVGSVAGRPAGPRLGVLERDELTGLPGRRWLQRHLAQPVPPGLLRGSLRSTSMRSPWSTRPTDRTSPTRSSPSSVVG